MVPSCGLSYHHRRRLVGSSDWLFVWSALAWRVSCPRPLVPSLVFVFEPLVLSCVANGGAQSGRGVPTRDIRGRVLGSARNLRSIGAGAAGRGSRAARPPAIEVPIGECAYSARGFTNCAVLLAQPMASGRKDTRPDLVAGGVLHVSTSQHSGPCRRDLALPVDAMPPLEAVCPAHGLVTVWGGVKLPAARLPSWAVRALVKR
jgi:hypothetical protein